MLPPAWPALTCAQAWSLSWGGRDSLRPCFIEEANLLIRALRWPSLHRASSCFAENAKIRADGWRKPGLPWAHPTFGALRGGHPTAHGWVLRGPGEAGFLGMNGAVVRSLFTAQAPLTSEPKRQEVPSLEKVWACAEAAVVGSRRKSWGPPSVRSS